MAFAQTYNPQEKKRKDLVITEANKCFCGANDY